MKIEAGKSYITSEGRVAHIELRPESHRTTWDFIDQHGFCYDEQGNCFWEKFKLVSPYVSVIERDDGVPMTLSEVEADVAAAQTKYGQRPQRVGAGHG